MKGICQFRPNFHAVGNVLRDRILARKDRPVMPYNFVADSIHTKKLRSRLCSSEMQFHTENGCSAFLSPLPHWGLGQRTMFILGLLESAYAAYGTGLPVSINCTFRYVLRLRRYVRTLKIGVFPPTGSVWPKILGRRSLPYQPFYSIF